MNNQSILFHEDLSDVYQGIMRTDKPVYPVFHSIFQGMQKRFWVPETISMSTDKAKFKTYPKGIQELITANIGWQVCADSDQEANLKYLSEHCNNIEVRRCIGMQAMEEDNHGGSYQYIINSMYDNPTAMLDELEENTSVQVRRDLTTNTGVLDTQSLHPAIKMLGLEGISFTSSFLTTLAASKHYPLPGTETQIVKIAADEAGHLVLWSNIIRILLGQKLVTASSIEGYLSYLVRVELDWFMYLSTLYPLPELDFRRVEPFLLWKRDQILRGVGITSPTKVEPNSIAEWYQSTIKINNRSTEGQAGDNAAYVTGGLADDWG